MTAILSAHQEETVHFYEVDPMNVMWHGHYFRLFEGARCKLMDRIQYNYDEMEKSGYIWPFVDFKIKYIRPLQLHQKVSVGAQLIEYENRLKIEYTIRNIDNQDILTKATSTQVAVKRGSDTLEFESPAILLEKVEGALL